MLLWYGVDMEVIDLVVFKLFFYLVIKYGYLMLVEFFLLYGVVIDGRDGSLRMLLYRWVKNFCLLFSFKGLDV